MIVDAILYLIYGMFDAVFSILPIPAIPDWYTTEIFPFLTQYVRMATGMISFAFPADLWVWLVRFMKDMILCRIIYDVYRKFHPLVRTSS